MYRHMVSSKGVPSSEHEIAEEAKEGKPFAGGPILSNSTHWARLLGGLDISVAHFAKAICLLEACCLVSGNEGSPLFERPSLFLLEYADILSR